MAQEMTAVGGRPLGFAALEAVSGESWPPTPNRETPTDRWPPTRMESKVGLVLPSLGRTARLFGRALLLRCRNCGKGPVSRALVQDAESGAGIVARIEAGRGATISLESMLFNYINLGVRTLVHWVCSLSLLIAAWPKVPWNALPAVLRAHSGSSWPWSGSSPSPNLIWLAFRPVSVSPDDAGRASSGTGAHRPSRSSG